jgi:hypothetical protein
MSMDKSQLKRIIQVPKNASLNKKQYQEFLQTAWRIMSGFPQYFAWAEDINSMELAHLIPQVPETIIAIYVGINDAVCNKGLVSPFLVRHGHNNVFVFDPQEYGGGKDVPGGTVDARKVLCGFEPPNSTWKAKWTYVMVKDPKRTFQSLWKEKGYIDMIPAKFEDFTMVSDPRKSKVCTFIDPKAFNHPVNKSRPYLKAARKRGETMASGFTIPRKLKGETDGLVPVILNQGEKLYVATTDFGPCAHAWSNIHPDNEEYAVINENSAVPLDLVIAKPPVQSKYASGLIPPKGSADMTTDWFYRGTQIVRLPLLQGLFKG